MCPYCDATLCAEVQAQRGVAHMPCLQPARLLPGESRPLPVGTRVEANWEGQGVWFGGKVRAVHLDAGRGAAGAGERYTVHYDDGDTNTTTTTTTTTTQHNHKH